MSELSLVVQWTIGALLVQAGGAKAWDVGSFRAGLQGYRLVPPPALGSVAVLVPTLELLLGVSLIAGLALPVVATTSCVLLAGFAGTQVVAYRRGMRVPCQCFGNDAIERISPLTISRSLALAAGSAALLFLPQSARPTLSLLPLVPLAVALALIARSVTVLPTVVHGLRARARLASTPTHTRRVSFRDAGLDVSLRAGRR